MQGAAHEANLGRHVFAGNRSINVTNASSADGRIGRNMIRLSHRTKDHGNPVRTDCAVAVTPNPALAQQPPPRPRGRRRFNRHFNTLPGRWVRLQGGYVITIRSVDADGKLDASYANPRPLPFHTAVASKDGNVLKLLFELRAGGYNGSTYTLRYDAADDRLTGVYDQVVVKQTFEVVFVRDKA